MGYVKLVVFGIRGVAKQKINTPKVVRKKVVLKGEKCLL